MPRLATARDLSRPTSDLGAFVAFTHRRRWLAWQSLTSAVIGERLPDGAMAYPIALVMVPRQCGKTTWLFDDLIGRCVGEADYRCAYTAQTGAAASERFQERLGLLGGTVLATHVKPRRSQGSERLTVPATQSFLKLFPPRDGALRGSALDGVVIDEAQEPDALLGTALDQTILPTFTTRRRRQLILVGTAGNESSEYLARYLALARGGAEGVALVEYGAAEDDDPTDPAVWWRVHPGLAAGLTDEAALRAALQVMGVEGFAREYLNVWSSKGNRLFSTKAWNLLRRAGAVPRPGTAPVFGVEVAADRSATAIMACWPDRDGVPVLEVVDYRPETEWAAERLRDLRNAHRPPMIVAADDGPVVTVVDAARRLGVTIRTTNKTEYATACQSSFDAIEHGRIAHRGEQPLNAAVAGAAKRPMGDAGWCWGRRASTSEVSPLTAGSLAFWGNQRRPARPMVDA